MLRNKNYVAEKQNYVAEQNYVVIYGLTLNCAFEQLILV